MVEDVSKKTILVLVILTMVVSVLGTLTVFSAMGDYNTQYSDDYSAYMTHPETSGQVSLTIGNGGVEPMVSTPVTGQVTLSIIR